jgi:hypothetical protein
MKQLFCTAIVCLPLFAAAQQVSDPHFRYTVTAPVYEPGRGPRIWFDEGHNNPHSLEGKFAALSRVLQQDGYTVLPGREKLSLPYLQAAKIFITINALYDPYNWDLPARSAFTPGEVDTLHNWVKEGGSLLLVTDHMPCGASVNDIAKAFGFNIINGFAQRRNRKEELFSRNRGNLHHNAITTGRNTDERVDSCMIWGGTGFLMPPGAQAITSLGDAYKILLPSKADVWDETTPVISGLGFVNAAYMPYGKGRIVVFGDGAPFSAQLEGIYGNKRGMNHPKAGQNAQLLLNIIHWLDGQLP